MNRYSLQFRKRRGDIPAPMNFDAVSTKVAMDMVLIFLEIRKGVLTEENFASHGGEALFWLQGKRKIQIFPPKKK